MTRLSIAGDSKAIEIKRSEQIRNAIGAPQVCSVTAPAADDGGSALAYFHDVVIIQRANGICVLEHHSRVSRDQGEVFNGSPVPSVRFAGASILDGEDDGRERNILKYVEFLRGVGNEPWQPGEDREINQ